MENTPKTPTVDQLRQMAPSKDAMVSSALNGVGNALMLATPVFVALDRGKDFITDRLKMPKLYEMRGRITVGLGAVVGLAGLVQGLNEAKHLQEYRTARLNYSEHMEGRVKALENLVKEKGWAETVKEQSQAPEGPTRG